MNMPYNQGTPQGLPFDPNQPQLQPAYVALGQPPFVPQVPYPPELGNHVPFLVSVVMMEIQNNMQKNQLRMFFYNLTSANGYLNDTFNRLVYFASQYVVMMLKSGQIQGTVEQAIMMVVPEMVTMFTSAAARDYPDLQALMQPAQQQEAGNQIARLDAIMGQVNQYVQSGGQMGMGMQRPMGGAVFGGQAPAMYGAPMAPQGPVFGGARPGYVQQGMMGAPMGAQYGQAPMPQSGPIFGNQPAAAQPVFQQSGPSPVSPGSTSRARAGSERMRRQLAEQLNPGQANAPQEQPPVWQAPEVQQPQAPRRHRTAADSLEAPQGVISEFTASGPKPTIQHMPVSQTFTGDVDPLSQTVAAHEKVTYPTEKTWPFNQTPAPVPPAPQPTTEEKEVDVLEDASAWRSHAGTRYLPGFHSRKTQPHYVTADGEHVTVAFYHRKPEEGTDMDYHKHAIGFVPTKESMLPKSNDHTEEPIADQPLDLPKLDIEMRPQARMESDEDSAAINYEFEARLVGKIGYGKPGKAYRAAAVVAKPIVCDTKEIADALRQSLTDLHNAGSFQEARNLIGQLSAPEQLPLRTMVNDLLTEEVNNALRMRMSLTDWIDDFYEDAVLLDGHLRGRYGDSVASALSRIESRLVSTAISTLSEEEANDYTNTLTEGLEGIEEPKNRVVYLTYRVSYTYLSVNAHELNFAAVPELPAMLSEDETGALYALVKSIYDDAEMRKFHFKRHFLYTLDGVKFEATRGLLNSDAYLIKRVRVVAH